MTSIVEKVKSKKKELKEKIPKLSAGDMPQTLASRYRRFVFISLVTFVAGIGVAMYMFPAPGWWLPSLVFFVLAAAMFVMAKAFQRNVLYNGYDKIEGTVILIKKKMLSLQRETKDAVAYHVKDDNGKTYQIPVYKSSVEVPLGERIVILVPKNVMRNERDGMTYFSTVWGYYLAAADDTSSDTAGNPPPEEPVSE